MDYLFKEIKKGIKPVVQNKHFEELTDIREEEKVEILRKKQKKTLVKLMYLTDN